MLTSNELAKLVVQKISEILPNAVCPLCQNPTWTVQPGTTFLPLKHQSETGSSYSQNALPLVALVCRRCGNSHLLNLSVLLPDVKGY